MLFGQGPVSFAHDVLSTLERKHRQRMTSATDKIERRVSSPLCVTMTLRKAIPERHFDFPSLLHVGFVLKQVPMCTIVSCNIIVLTPLLSPNFRMVGAPYGTHHSSREHQTCHYHLLVFLIGCELLHRRKNSLTANKQAGLRVSTHKS